VTRVTYTDRMGDSLRVCVRSPASAVRPGHSLRIAVLPRLSSSDHVFWTAVLPTLTCGAAYFGRPT